MHYWVTSVIKTLWCLFLKKKLVVTATAASPYPIISHKGAGAYIRIFKIYGFMDFENRPASRRPAPIFFSQKYNIFLYKEHFLLSKLLCNKKVQL